MSSPSLEVFKKRQVEIKHKIPGWSPLKLPVVLSLSILISVPWYLCFQNNFNDIYIFLILKGIMKVKERVLITHAKIQRRNALF